MSPAEDKQREQRAAIEGSSGLAAVRRQIGTFLTHVAAVRPESGAGVPLGTVGGSGALVLLGFFGAGVPLGTVTGFRSRLTVATPTPTTFAIARWLASMVAARLVTTEKHRTVRRPGHDTSIDVSSQSEAAVLLTVSTPSVKRAQALLATKDKDQLDWQRYVGR